LTALHDALAEHGQTTVLEGNAASTVGGTLCVGASGLRRLRTGPLRDALLEARYVSAEGRLVVAGGPTVKNVAGYDLCRLLVGSLGTLGFLGEVVLRTRPVPQAAQWMVGNIDPGTILCALHRPSCVLWDGTTTWTLLEGYRADVDAERDVVRSHGMTDASDGPALPPVRSSVSPAAALALGGADGAGRFVAEIGVGVVHGDHALPAPAPDQRVLELHRRVKHEFDPNGRCNPGRDPLRRAGEAAA
jgi:glycolate oxidase FAD binding subunit